ncbi:MAG: GTP cyclohydrolase IIa [Halobacteriota archaeon]
MVQVTLVQIDNYGPWTVTPEPRREADLQALQAELYADLSRAFGSHGGTAFYNRFDNVVAVTDGTTEEDHRAIQRGIGNRYPVTVSMAVASHERPRHAVERATEMMQREGGAQDAARVEALAYDGGVHGDVQVAHFDVEDVTTQYTDRVDAFEATLSVQSAYTELSRLMWREHDSPTFFVGGDNYVSLTPGLAEQEFEGVLDAVEAATDVRLRVGVGESTSPERAGLSAKQGLEHSRERGVAVEFVRSPA